MTTSHTDPIACLANTLMRSVVNSGAVSTANADVAVRIMREELKAFIADDKYADERALVQTGGEHLAMASLTTECVSRILADRSYAALPPRRGTLGLAGTT